MDERIQPTIRALDCPALGLLVLLAGLVVLPDQLSLAVAWGFGATERGMSAAIVLQLVAAGLQIATGVVVVRRAPARPLFVAWCVAALAAALAAASALSASDRALVLNAEMFEIVAGPVMVLLAPLVIDVERLSDRRSPADVAAALLVLAIAALLTLSLEIVGQIRIWGGIRAAWPVLSSALIWGPGAVRAVITLHAGRVLLRPGPPAAARKALVLYVVVSIAVGALHSILGIITIVSRGLHGHAAMLFSTPVAALVIAVARPLMIWAYARPVLREPIAIERRELAGPLVWGVLWSVPLLIVSAGRVATLHPDRGAALATTIGALLCGQALCNVAVAREASRNPDHALRAASIASALCAGLLVTVVAWAWTMFDPTFPLGFRFSPQAVGRPLATLLALLATLAWSQRSTLPELPRATLRSG